MSNTESKLLPMSELHEGVLASVVVKCTDCDFFRTGSLQFIGSIAAEGKTIGSCRNHHLMEDFKYNSMLDEVDKKPHNSFSITIPTGEEYVGRLAISSQTKAQIVLYENARQHIKQIP